MNNTTVLTSSPLSFNILVEVLYKFGVIMCIITAAIAIIGGAKHKDSIVVKAIIGFALSIMCTMALYNQT